VLYYQDIIELIMPENEISQILKDMEEHGFPLEVKTSEVLETKGWEVTNQAAYTDYEEGKQKTVDVIAEKDLLKNAELTVGLFLVIECKRSTKPWVFYATDFNLNKPEQTRKAVSSSQFFINKRPGARKSGEILLKLMDQFLLQTHLRSPIFSKLAYIPFEAFTGGELRSIHKARMQVCNAILDVEKRLKETKFPVSYGIVLIPIIVLDGHLYTYKNKQLNPEKGLYYYFTYVDYSFMIEIVTEDFFDTYLSTIEEQIENFQAK